MKEHTSDEHGGQEPQADEGSTATSLLTVKDETPSHITNGSLRGNQLKHEKSVSERLDGAHAGEKAGGSVYAEKTNGSATTDKNKKSRGELPFTKQEREEMEALLHEVCGHLGQFSSISTVLQLLNCTFVTQLFILHDFWKVKTSRRTFCSTPTGCCPYQYTTRHRPHGYRISYHSP